jgi:hypothetical protein
MWRTWLKLSGLPWKTTALLAKSTTSGKERASTWKVGSENWQLLLVGRDGLSSSMSRVREAVTETV